MCKAPWLFQRPGRKDSSSAGLEGSTRPLAAVVLEISMKTSVVNLARHYNTRSSHDSLRANMITPGRLVHICLTHRLTASIPDRVSSGVALSMHIQHACNSRDLSNTDTNGLV